MNGADRHSLFLLDSSKLQQDLRAGEHHDLVWCSALLVAACHVNNSAFCWVYESYALMAHHLAFAAVFVCVGLLARRFGPATWVRLLLMGAGFAAMTFFMLESGVWAAAFYILMPVPALRVLGLALGSVVAFAYLVLAIVAINVVKVEDLSATMRLSLLISSVFSVVLGIALELLRRRHDRRLAGMLKSLRVLGGLIPICSKCKKVREADDSWREIEGLLRREGQVEFSHGLCTNCFGDAEKELED